MKSITANVPVKTQSALPQPRWLDRFPFLIRLFNWEYWPAKLTNLPVIGFWLYFAAKARHLFFFTAANPAIETGGVLGESKIDILDQIPDQYKPLTLFIPAQTPVRVVIKKMADVQLNFPLVVKPNVGERGNGVEKIDTLSALIAYLETDRPDLILQEYIDYPEEYSVLYHRFPGEQTGHISSLCRKAYLTVREDGVQSLLSLIKANPRALLQLPTLQVKMGQSLDRVPAHGEEVLLVPIGNHARGTKFLNANEEIDADLVRTFDQISDQLDGIYVGRFDLKTRSLAHLKRGEDVKLLEINGVAGEPAHIYDPSYSVRQAYRDLFAHWQMVYAVSQEAHRQGVPYMGFREAWSRLWVYLRYLKRFF